MKIEKIEKIKIVYEIGDRFQTNKELTKLGLRRGIYMIVKIDKDPTWPDPILTIVNSNAGTMQELSSVHLKPPYILSVHEERILTRL